MNNISKDNLYPLSLSQLNILNLERAFSGTSVNNISTTVRILGSVDFVALQQSINLVIETDPSLRLQLVTVDGCMMQFSAPFTREEFPVYDFSNTSSEGIENWETAVTRELIPLEGGPLYRFILFRDSENSGGILVKLHHIIADGWSQIMICNKIGKTYLELLSGKEPSLEIAPEYCLHIQEEKDYISSKAFSRDEKYWKSVVDQIGEPSSLKNVYGATVSPVGRRMSFELPQVINHAIFSFCQEKRVAPFAVFYMALAIYFKRNGCSDRFTIGVPIFNRTSYEFKQSTGMFVTTLPFYNEINDEWTLNTFNEDLMDKWYEMLRHQRYPFSKICDLSGKDGRLFNIALSYQDSKIYESRDASVHFSGRWHYCGYQAEQLTIHVTNLKDHQQYAVDYDYLSQYFTESEISALHNNLCHILNETLNEPNKPIHSLNILSLEEKEKVLYTFNKTDKYLEDKSVYDALLHNSRSYLNRVAIIHNGERMTYGALLHRSAQFAYAISENIKGTNELIAVLLPRKFDLPAAMIGVLQQECAYLILSDSLPRERIRKILNQSEASLLLTDDKGLSLVGECDIPVVTVDVVDESYGIPIRGTNCFGCELQSDKLAYVVYTSGSTGEPKGVEITQRNLLNLAQEMEPVYGSGAVLSVCNIGFDAFMLESIVALINGRTVVFPTDSDLESPERLAELMNGYAVGFFAMTPSRLSVLLSNKTFKKVMHRMESIVCGGEHFPTELLKKLKSCTNARIYNQYGPSETTVTVSMKELSRADKITIGSPLGNCKMYVLDQWLNPLPIGGKGRLYIGGKCVGRGYRNLPDFTEKVFKNNPFINEDRIYDTGDLAQWTSSGEIVLTGRADSQVKLRGLRIELQEISSCVESFPGVIGAYSKICKVGGVEVLGVYYSSERIIGESELISHAATYLPDYMIPSFFMHVPFLPMTANGKIDEASLPIPVIEFSEDNIVLSSEAESILSIFKKILNNSSLTASSDYFRNGGNSLNAMQCVMEIEEQLSKKIRIADLYACRTAVKLAAFIKGESVNVISPKQFESDSKAVLVKKNKKSEYMLRGVQQGMYIQSVIDRSSIAYNMPGAFKFEKMPDIERLERAFVKLIESDPIFRTVFVSNENGVTARILDSVCFNLETLVGDTFEAAAQKFIRPFDLTEAPLLRAGLWVNSDDEYYLFIDSHHIIGDGLSVPIILQRLDKAYNTEYIKVEWDFYDYLNSIDDAELKSTSDMAYWKEHLSNLPDKLELYGDFPRPKLFDYKGKDYQVLFNEEESRACEEFCKNSGYTEYVIGLAAFAILLSAVSGQKDMIIGAPISGRTLMGTAEICGPFINTLPIRLNLTGLNTVDELLGSIRNEVSLLLDHQDVSLENIINELGLPHGQQNALYNFMFTQSPVDISSFSISDIKLHFTPISTGDVKMDMIVELAKVNNRLSLNFSYATSLFCEETIEFYGRCIKNIVKSLIGIGEKKLSDIRIISDFDNEKLVETPNYSVTPFINRPIHKLLKKTSTMAGTETAIIFHGQKTTFEQLEMRANLIAEFIVSKGVSAGSCIAICMRRTPDLVATMYGVLKAGCAYMFILDSFPETRINYMLSVSSAALILYDSEVSLPGNLNNGTNPVDAFILPDGYTTEEFDANVSDKSLVNVLFTSGSTGQPKGVMLSHRSVCNLYSQMKAMLTPVEGNVLCSTNSVFDCFIVETMIALALGRTVVLADEEEMMLPWKLAALVEKYNTGIFEMTPSRLNMCLGNAEFRAAAKYIRIVLLGGEVVTDNLMNKFYDCSDGVLMNMYGPTEATVFTTAEPLKRGEHITIGRPLQNTRAYVLDENLKPVIPTACGEMYISGECLSLGYIGREDITEQSFIDDIYFPGEKMYRSGDIVRLRIDGRFDYIGRKDSQIKLNGQRVELSEINGAIESSAQNVQAASIHVKDEDGSMNIYSFYVTDDDSLTSEEIYSNLKKVLPLYMIPSAVIKIDSMPMTATNKIDILALKNYIGNGNKKEDCGNSDMAEFESQVVTESIHYSSSDGESEVSVTVPDIKYVLSVWNSVLPSPITSEDVSFFECGGTSMAALTVLGRYYSDKFEISFSEFYENQTVKQQSALLKSKINIIEDVVPEVSVKLDSKDDKKAAFVSGATGFFGAHLVKELIETDSCEVICLVRDGNRERLSETLSFYFGKEKCTEMMSVITVVSGDISKIRLGMSEADYDELTQKIDSVYHSAADVRHYAADTESYMKTNVGGTENMIALAEKAGVKFYHFSTCSIAGASLKHSSQHVDYTENDFDIDQVWENNIYVRSKYLAEKAVFEAIDRGLNAKIFRLGRLVGRDDDGTFQINPETNAFYLMVKGFKQLGVVPSNSKDKRIDIMPIDRSAKQVLALRNCERRVYHIMNHNPPTFGEIMSSVNADNHIVDMAEFRNILNEKALGLDGSLLGIIIDTVRSNTGSEVITVTNSFTTEDLRKVGYSFNSVDIPTVLKSF